MRRPLKLTLALTWRCHHRCGICAIWSREKGREMTVNQLDRLFASVPRLTWLDLTGGEVVAREDLADIAAVLHRRLPRLALLHFPTAGMRPEATERAARAMVRPGGPRVIVTVSLDGPQAVHDRLRGMPGAFERALETWQRLDAVPGLAVYAGMTLQPGNLDQVDATVAAIAQARPGFSHADLHVNFLHRSGHYFGNEAVAGCAPEAVARALADLRLRKGVARGPVAAIEAAYLKLVPQNLATGRSPLPCRSGELSAYVAPDGTVYACTIDGRPAGRLEDFAWDLGALWEGDARRALRTEVAADRCAGCWTPCEAYQTLLTQPVALARALRQPERQAGNS